MAASAVTACMAAARPKRSVAAAMRGIAESCSHGGTVVNGVSSHKVRLQRKAEEGGEVGHEAFVAVAEVAEHV